MSSRYKFTSARSVVSIPAERRNAQNDLISLFDSLSCSYSIVHRSENRSSVGHSLFWVISGSSHAKRSSRASTPRWWTSGSPVTLETLAATIWWYQSGNAVASRIVMSSPITSSGMIEVNSPLTSAGSGFLGSAFPDTFTM